MNLNLLSYLIYFPAMALIAIRVAQVCHREGRPWMLGIFDGDARFVDAVRAILLVACYSVNVGYIALTVSAWPPIDGLGRMLGILAGRISLILFILAWLHYQNIAVLLIWSRMKQRAIAHRSAAVNENQGAS